MRPVSVAPSDQHADMMVEIFERLGRLERGVAGVRSGNQPSVRARHGSTVATTTGVAATMTWTAAEDYDTDGFHDTVTNPSRLTVPDGLAGLYLVGYTLTIPAASGLVETWITRGGTGVWASMQQPAAAGGLVHSCADIVPLAVGEWVDMRVRQASGGGVSVWSSIDALWWTRLGPWLT